MLQSLFLVELLFCSTFVHLAFGSQRIFSTEQHSFVETEDLTQYVDLFVGTFADTQAGNVFPGASIPFGMASPGIDVNTFSQPGYYSNPEFQVESVSLIHTSGTGGSESYGTFGSMPINCPNDNLSQCGVLKPQRTRPRKMNGDNVADIAMPGYFQSTLQDGTILEMTSTRRASLIRYTFPNNSSKPFVTIDWTEAKSDTSFKGIGSAQFKTAGDGTVTQLLLNGTFTSSFAEPFFTNNVFGCFDLNAEGDQSIDEYAMWTSNNSFQQLKFDVNQTFAEANYVNQSGPFRGAVVGYNRPLKTSNGKNQIVMRTGISFVSAEQACQNAQEEIPDYDFAKVVAQSKALWNDKLSRIQLDPNTDSDTKKLFYTSLYRSFLTPSNATGESQGPFLGNPAPYFDALYCSWDTFRTFFPLLSLTSPQDYADITANYIESSKVVGYIPECRANNNPGLAQGGSDGVNIVADFAVKYRNSRGGVNFDDLYSALYRDATYDSKTFNWGGRQIGIYEQYGYIPGDYVEPGIYGLQFVQSSRTAEYAFNDFGIRNVAILLNKTDDIAILTNRSYFYKNIFDSNVKSLGFQNFMQKRLLNGSFENYDPLICSPANTKIGPCNYDGGNVYGFYESSSWEYSFYVPQDFAGLIKLVSNNSFSNFISRIDTFFKNDLFGVGDEPSFQLPITYHYANAPAKSVDRVRSDVLTTFNLTRLGIPGNDDSGAMASLAVFHLLGLYPVPSTREFLIVSPSMPSYTLNNAAFGSVTVTAKGFSNSILDYSTPIPDNATAYVKSVSINGQIQSSRCKISFDQIFPAAASTNPTAQTVQVVFEMGTKAEVTDCGPNSDDLPSSLSTGGFASF